MNDIRQALYLIADEMRGMACMTKQFSDNVYELERAQRLMHLAAKVGALAEDGDSSPEEVRTLFDARPWLRVSPAIGVDALIVNPAGEVLMLRRRDNGRWGLPGGVLEIGETPAQGVLREAWEEAGVRGTVARLLGMFDARAWGSRAKAQYVALTFLVTCDDYTPAPGIEMLEAAYFAPDGLPDLLHYGYERRLPKCLELLRSGETYFDPAASTHGDLPMHQRPKG
ncbi:MAG TPA: NUDIX domain-containing protein [Aggregatilineales bacterium]|nr:NUDIX domain-containing protein [Aggregatilineales bacterium]